MDYSGIHEFVVTRPDGSVYGTSTFEDARDKLWRCVTCWAINQHDEDKMRSALAAAGVYYYDHSIPDCSPVASALTHNRDSLTNEQFINRHVDQWPRSAAYVKEAKGAWDAREGPRVGDMCFRPSITEDGPFRKRESRFTHAWDDGIQAGGGGGSFHMYTSGGVSYSGGLDESVPRDKLRLMPDVKRYGTFWFFKDGWSGAHRGVSFQLPIRTYEEIA